MKSKLIAAAVTAFAAMGSTGAFAMSHQYGEAALVVGPVASTSVASRSQVQADYLKARQNGALSTSNEGAFAAMPAISTNVTRAEVRAQAAMSRMSDGRNAL